MSAWSSGSGTASIPSYFVSPSLTNTSPHGPSVRWISRALYGLAGSMVCSTSSICSTIHYSTGTGLIGSTAGFSFLIGGTAATARGGWVSDAAGAAGAFSSQGRRSSSNPPRRRPWSGLRASFPFSRSPSICSHTLPESVRQARRISTSPSEASLFPVGSSGSEGWEGGGIERRFWARWSNAPTAAPKEAKTRKRKIVVVSISIIVQDF